ncbi:MAG TPA: hypothetical protein VL418_11665 [Devosiaceae bacterium]|nr:hypothetical protein [Devosiaceae bacterium]
MAENSYEVVIFGSTPLAALMAGLLATRHHKRVCLVTDAGSAFRLPRGIDLSVMPVTRPETWALLKEATSETLRLIGQIRARQGMQRIDPIFAADGAEGSAAISHMRHVASGFGYAVEPLPAGAASSDGAAYRLRDAVLLKRTELMPLIEAWLEQAGVGRLDDGELAVTLKRDGSARLRYAGSTIEAAHAVLADDAAILAHLDLSQGDRILRVQRMTAMLTEPTGALAAPLMIYPESGVALLRNRRGGVLALGAGAPEIAHGHIGRYLFGHAPLRQAGQGTFRTVATLDGAPLVGFARGFKGTVIAGLGISGAFLAPALARLIARTPSERETRYFSAREAGNGNTRAAIADYAGMAMGEAPT